MRRREFITLVVGITAWPLTAVGIANAQSVLIKRGDYLVNGILTCGNCHTPKGPTGDITDKMFSGGLNWDEPPFKVTAPNITQDKETGIGNYTDAELRQVLRKGIKRNGVPVAMVMPSGFYEIMTDRDLDAVIAYLHTIKPIKNTVPDPVCRMAQGHPIPPGGETPLSEAMMSDKVKKGFYLVTIAHCMECHTPMGPNGREFGSRLGAGGFAFPGPWGVSVSRLETSENLGNLAATSGDASMVVTHRRLAAIAATFAGEHTSARDHAQYVLNHPSSASGTTRMRGMFFDQRISARTMLARTLWQQGFADQARECAQEGLALGLSLEHDLSVCLVLAHAVAPIALWSGELDRAAEMTGLLLTRSRDVRFGS